MNELWHGRVRSSQRRGVSLAEHDLLYICYMSVIYL